MFFLEIFNTKEGKKEFSDKIKFIKFKPKLGFIKKIESNKFKNSKFNIKGEIKTNVFKKEIKKGILFFQKEIGVKIFF